MAEETPVPIGVRGAYNFEPRGNLFDRVKNLSENQERTWSSLPYRIYLAYITGPGFDWWPKKGIHPPQDQVDFINNTLMPLIYDISSREKELGSRNISILWDLCSRAFSVACVADVADTKSAEVMATQIQKTLESMLLRRQKSRLFWNAIFNIIVSGIMFFICFYYTISQTVVNLILVAATCILTDGVMLRTVASVSTFPEYEQKKYLLDSPILRVTLLAVSVEILAIICWRGGAEIRIGEINLKNITTDPWVASIFGALGGFLGSDITKYLVALFKKSVASQPEKPRPVQADANGD